MNDADEPITPTDGDVQATVRTFLAAMGLCPSDDEIAVLTSQYATHQASVTLLHSTTEARYESPALIFDPTPVFAEW